MVNFEDLSPKDKEKLLQQARLIVEQESITKNASATYKIKRKELTDNSIDEISKALHMSVPEKHGFKQRYISIVNYLFKFVINGKYSSNDYVISNAIEWNLFEKVNAIIKNALIECYGLRKDK